MNKYCCYYSLSIYICFPSTLYRQTQLLYLGRQYPNHKKQPKRNRTTKKRRSGKDNIKTDEKQIYKMGCTGSKELDPEEKAAAKANANIDRMIRNDKKIADRTVKILLLGAGESGKSTIIKQMRIIHAGGFPHDERRQTRAVIYSNLVVAFKVILDIMKTESISFEQCEKSEVSIGLLCSCLFGV